MIIKKIKKLNAKLLLNNDLYYKSKYNYNYFYLMKIDNDILNKILLDDQFINFSNVANFHHFLSPFGSALPLSLWILPFDNIITIYFNVFTNSLLSCILIFFVFHYIPRLTLQKIAYIGKHFACNILIL